MNKDKISEIIKFSFFKYFQNKWFIIFNILSLLSIVIGLNWPNFSSVISFINKEDKFEIAVLDNSNILYDQFANSLPSGDKYTINRITENNYTSGDIPKELIIIEVYEDEDKIEPFKLKIITKEGLDNNVYNDVYASLDTIRNEKLKQRFGVSTDTITLIKQPVSIERIMLAVDASDSLVKNLINYFSAAITYLLAVIVFTRISNEVSQEKASKSSEYILTSVNEKEYLFAKVFSNIIILVIQILLLIAYYVIAVSIFSIFKTTLTDISILDSLSMGGISKELVGYVIAVLFYNIITLILMSIIQATLAAKTASPLEAGNTTSILAFIMMVLYIFTISAINPYTSITPIMYGLSLLPIISGFLIPAMIMIGQASWIQIIISIVLMIVLIPKAFNYCAGIFKNGLLDYTKKPKSNSDIDLSKDSSLKTLLNKRSFKQLGSVLGISIIIYIGSQTIFSFVFKLILDSFDDAILNVNIKFLLLQMLSQITSLGLAYLFIKGYLTKQKKIVPQSLIISKTKLVTIALSLDIILQIGLGFLYPIIGLDYKNDLLGQLNVNYTSSFATKILFVLTIAMIPAIFEELFFRKGLISLLEKHGKVFAVLLSALLFGAIHMNLGQFLFAFIIGLIMGIIYAYTKDIKLTILIHFLNNGFEAISLILPPESINPAYSILMSFLVIVVMLAGIAYFVTFIKNKENRLKFMQLCLKKTEKGVFRAKYVYIFYDYIFDISILLIIVASFFTERLFRL